LNSGVVFTGTVTTCPNPLYEFWIKYANGVWTLGQAYSSSPTMSWNTTGNPVGSYLISIWSRDARSPNSYDSFSAFTYSLTIAPAPG
jgi:hypothetical protein